MNLYGHVNSNHLKSISDSILKSSYVSPGLPNSNTIYKQLANHFKYDTFGHLQTAPVHTLFDSALLNDDKPQLWTNSTYGTQTYLPGRASKNIQTTSGVSGRAISQSRLYQSYQSGKMLTVLITGVLSVEGPQTNIIHRIGFFDNAADKTIDDVKSGDGHYFGLDENGVFIAERSYSITGSQTETIIRQADFNYDTIDGFGPSGFKFDPTKANIFCLTYQWLGVGSVWMMLVVDGNKIPVHHWQHSNIYDYPYTGRATLPVRYEVEALNNTLLTGTTRQICSSVQSSGGYVPLGNIFSIDTNSTHITIDNTNYRMLIAIRKKSSHVRMTLNSVSCQIMSAGTAKVHIDVLAYPGEAPSPFSSAPTWISNNQYSAIEYSVSPGINMDFTNGAVVDSFYYYDRASTDIANIRSRNLFGADIEGNSDFIVLCAKSVDGNTENIYASIQILET